VPTGALSAEEAAGLADIRAKIQAGVPPYDRPTAPGDFVSPQVPQTGTGGDFVPPAAQAPASGPSAALGDFLKSIMTPEGRIPTKGELIQRELGIPYANLVIPLLRGYLTALQASEFGYTGIGMTAAGGLAALDALQAMNEPAVNLKDISTIYKNIAEMQKIAAETGKIGAETAKVGMETEGLRLGLPGKAAEAEKKSLEAKLLLPKTVAEIERTRAETASASELAAERRAKRAIETEEAPLKQEKLRAEIAKTEAERAIKAEEAPLKREKLRAEIAKTEAERAAKAEEALLKQEQLQAEIAKAKMEETIRQQAATLAEQMGLSPAAAVVLAVTRDPAKAIAADKNIKDIQLRTEAEMRRRGESETKIKKALADIERTQLDIEIKRWQLSGQLQSQRDIQAELEAGVLPQDVAPLPPKEQQRVLAEMAKERFKRQISEAAKLAPPGGQTPSRPVVEGFDIKY
jgi:hypothetical protein